ncbi:DUF6884 domain-containing protein [Armatimonas sp.]|uniref:DUF6884 domain-containing protein n=1 Tax=Armatimonas sp. TaxID=1872638 RepID=UPI00374D0FB2
MKNIVLIGCSASKADTPIRAAEMYTGELFKLSRRWAESCGGGIYGWWILSAKWGLLTPGQTISPYDETLDTTAKTRTWGGKVRQDLHDCFHGFSKNEPVRFIVLAGKAYSSWNEPLFLPLIWCTVERPLAGLGIGQQKAALCRMIPSLATDKHAWPHIPLPDRVERSLATIGASL